MLWVSRKICLFFPEDLQVLGYWQTVLCRYPPNFLPLHSGKEQNPEESVKAAIKYIAATDRSFSMIPDKEERLNFILASYNAGLGHIYDAMALAEKYGKNKLVWKDNVENFILLKSNEEYFTDPVCKNGYFRGIETYNFVRDIVSRYESYKKKIKA